MRCQECPPHGSALTDTRWLLPGPLISAHWSLLPRYEAVIGDPPKARFLDVILYSHAQIVKENAAMGNPPPAYENPWGIISVKAQDVDVELPMNPITMMRNALGRDQGGSGVELVEEKYRRSVAFWSANVVLKSTQPAAKV